MNRGQKEILVTTLKQDFSESNASFLISLKGISVAKMQVLRKNLKANGGKLKVAKDRLVKIAIKDISCTQDLSPYLKNQLGVVFSNNDPVAVAKILYNFAKENEQLKIVAACFESKIIEKDSIEKIAKLPSREVLIAQICGMLKIPMAKLAIAVDAVKQKLEAKN